MLELAHPLPRRPLLLGEAVPFEGMKPFQYIYDGKKVETTKRVLEAVYGIASPKTYDKLCIDFALGNCLDCAVPSGQRIEPNDALDTKISGYLLRHINDVEHFSPKLFIAEYHRQKIYREQDLPRERDNVSHLELPQFAWRRIFLFGRGTLSLFERYYLMRDLTDLRKSQEEIFQIGKDVSDSDGSGLYISFSITPLFHPARFWNLNYKAEDRKRLGSTLKEASTTWAFDWDYNNRKFFFNKEITVIGLYSRMILILVSRQVCPSLMLQNPYE